MSAPSKSKFAALVQHPAFSPVPETAPPAPAVPDPAPRQEPPPVEAAQVEPAPATRPTPPDTGAVRPLPPTRAVAKRNRVAGTGKRKNPDYFSLTVYVKKSTHRALKIELAKREDNLEMGDLIDRLLLQWLKTQARS